MSRRWSRLVVLAALAACKGDDTDLGRTGEAAGDGGPEVAVVDAAPVALSASDVSFLFPLPGEAELDLLLAPSAVGFTRELAEQLPPLVADGASDEYAMLRVTAARFDPCADDPCRAELRLVVQVVLARPDATLAVDGAFHLFFRIDDGELAGLAAELRALAARGPGPATSLAVHPGLALGLAGPYAATLRELILDHAGQDRLYRVAQMTRAVNTVWDFRDARVEGAVLAAQAIPRIDATLQQVFDGSSDTVRLQEVRPAPPDGELAALLDSSRFAAFPGVAWDAAIAGSLRLDHPEKAATDATDCASCHLSTRARRAGLAQRIAGPEAMAEAFDAGGLESGDAGGEDPKAVMAFAYRGADPMVNDRTVNESVLAARRFDALR